MAFSDEDIQKNGPDGFPVDASVGRHGSLKAGSGAKARSKSANGVYALQYMRQCALEKTKPGPVKILKKKDESDTST